jgi:protein involved in polysaccharide export with SLBB domain
MHALRKPIEAPASVSFRPLSARTWLGPLLCFLAGCAAGQPSLDRALLTNEGFPARAGTVAESYHVACPDVLEVRVDRRPPLSGRKAIGADGRIDLGELGRVRVERLTESEVACRVAEEAEIPTAWVRVQVVEYNSQQVFLIGQVAGAQRAVPYQGPETVVDLLHRIGGLTAGAAPEEVYVVRSRLVEGKRPEVFRVDLHAILLRNDPRTNVALQPLDQVFVGESGRFSFEKCVPPWLRPLYEAFCGMRRPPAKQAPQDTQIARAKSL